MKSKNLFIFMVAVAAMATAMLQSCKTSEENYRKAYLKAVENRDPAAAIDSTIYGQHRRQMGSQLHVVGGDTIEVFTHRVKVTPDGGGIPEWLKPYNLVVGQFKQLFNAQSLRQRLVDAGYPRTFVVETAEPYFYIVLDSYANETEAASALKALKANASDFPTSMRSPLPFILKAK